MGHLAVTMGALQYKVFGVCVELEDLLLSLTQVSSVFPPPQGFALGALSAAPGRGLIREGSF